MNLASHLLLDAFQKTCDVAVVMSNDSDLRVPIRIAEQELGVRVGIINPHPPEYRSRVVRGIGAYLTGQWLPGKKINLAQSTWDWYRRKIDRHILPAIGQLRIRRLRAHHLETLHDRMLIPPTVAAHWRPRPCWRCISSSEAPSRCDEAGPGQPERGPRGARSETPIDSERGATGLDSPTVQAFLQAAIGHRLFPAFWLLASTGMRRSELLGLRWDDIDFIEARLSVNRGLVAVAYELHESRGKTPNSRRAIDLDPTTIKVLKA